MAAFRCCEEELTVRCGEQELTLINFNQTVKERRCDFRVKCLNILTLFFRLKTADLKSEIYQKSLFSLPEKSRLKNSLLIGYI